MKNCTSSNGTTTTTPIKLYHKMEEDEKDLSLLRRPPIETSFLGFQEAKKAWDYGTKEMRRLLMNECNIIYECNYCRNMFRSLTNFIMHKRSFCRDLVCLRNNKGFSDENSVTMQINTTAELKKIDINSPNVKYTEKDYKKNLNLKNIPTERNVQEKVEVNKLEEVLVPKTKNTSSSEIKEEILELVKKELHQQPEKITQLDASIGRATRHNKNETKVQRKIVNISAQSTQTLPNQFKCTSCQSSFPTAKALKIHFHRKHIQAEKAIQCPTSGCSLTFTQSSTIIRHLVKDHNESASSIRMLRDTILKHQIQRENCYENRQSLQKVTNNCEDKPSPIKADAENVKPKKLKLSCGNCNLIFECRSSLTTHLLNCKPKQTAVAQTPVADYKPAKLQKLATIRLLENHFGDKDTTITKELKEDIDSNALDIDMETLNEMFANLEKQSFEVGIKMVGTEKLVTEVQENNCSQFVKKTDLEKSTPEISVSVEKQNEDSPELELESQTKTEGPEVSKVKKRKIVKHLSCLCKICNKPFNALSNLRRHISMFHYRSQKFGCKLCDYRAFRRYDIVNHLAFVHRMTGERENLALEYVCVNEVVYSKDDMEGDIMVIEDNKKLALVQQEVNTSLQQNETPVKNSEDLISVEANNSTSVIKKANSKQKKSKRLSSLSSSSEKLDNDIKELEKRPIRNRIKPVNKDFVYDLPGLVKTTESTEKEASTLRGIKRRSNGSLNADEINSSKESSCYIDDSLPIEPLINEKMLDIGGAVRRISLLLISQGRAKSATLPELPTERPQMRTRPTFAYTVPVIDATELEAARMKSTLLDDAFLVKMARHSVDNFKIKPCLALEHSALNTLLKKVDNGLKYSNPNATVIVDNSILERSTAGPINSIYYPTVVETELSPILKGNSEEFIEPKATIPKYTSPPPKPKKRITLMQRLAENKAAAAAKQRESLLRSALEN